MVAPSWAEKKLSLECKIHCQRKRIPVVGFLIVPNGSGLVAQISN